MGDSARAEGAAGKHKAGLFTCVQCRRDKRLCDKRHPCNRCTSLGYDCVMQTRGRGRPPRKHGGHKKARSGRSVATAVGGSSKEEDPEPEPEPASSVDQNSVSPSDDALDDVQSLEFEDSAWAEELFAEDALEEMAKDMMMGVTAGGLPTLPESMDVFEDPFPWINTDGGQTLAPIAPHAGQDAPLPASPGMDLGNPMPVAPPVAPLVAKARDGEAGTVVFDLLPPTRQHQQQQQLNMSSHSGAMTASNGPAFSRIERPLVVAEPVDLAFESISRGLSKLTLQKEGVDIRRVRWARQSMAQLFTLTRQHFCGEWYLRFLAGVEEQHQAAVQQASPSTSMDGYGQGALAALPSPYFLEDNPPGVDYVKELLNTPGAASTFCSLTRRHGLDSVQEQVRCNALMSDMFMSVQEICRAAAELSTIFPTVLARLMTRDSIEAFYTCFTHCFIPGEHEKEAHCVVQAQRRDGVIVPCLSTCRWDWGANYCIMAFRFWPLDTLMASQLQSLGTRPSESAIQRPFSPPAFAAPQLPGMSAPGVGEPLHEAVAAPPGPVHPFSRLHRTPPQQQQQPHTYPPAQPQLQPQLQPHHPQLQPLEKQQQPPGPPLPTWIPDAPPYPSPPQPSYTRPAYTYPAAAPPHAQAPSEMGPMGHGLMGPSPKMGPGGGDQALKLLCGLLRAEVGASGGR